MEQVDTDHTLIETIPENALQIDLDLFSFDVVIPTKNSEGTIRECLRALYASDIPVNRVFIVDKSRDSTIEIATEMDCICIPSDANYCQALRLGASLCETPYFVIIDSDIRVHPQFYSRLRPHIKENFVTKGVFYDQIAWHGLSQLLLEIRRTSIGGLDAAFVERSVFLRLTKDWSDGSIDAGGDTQLFRKCGQLGIPTFQDPVLVNIHLVGSCMRYISQARWYGKSGRKNRLYHWTHFPKRFLNGVIRSFRVAFQRKDLRFIPFFINEGWMYFWGWLRG